MTDSQLDQEQEYDKLARAVGYALSEWTRIEDALLMMFLLRSGTIVGGKGTTIFGAIVSFEVRLSICTALMRSSNDPDLQLWNYLHDKISRFYKKRHQIAHFALVSSHTGQADGTSKTTKVFLSPFWPLGGKNVELSVSDIETRRAKFRELAEAVFWFNRRFAWQAHGGGSPPPEPHLVQHIRSLIAQKNAEQ